MATFSAASAPSIDSLLRSSRFRTSTHGTFYNDRAQCPRPSHNDLFGGMYKIDDSDTDIETEFHHLLLGAIDSGKLYGLSENRTQFSALYFDLDFKGTAVVNTDTLVRIVHILRTVLGRAGGEDYDRVSSALIATSPSARDGDLVKTGVHIIFPHIILGLGSMQIINVACRDAVEAEFGVRMPPENSWTDVFDLGVYRGGLRMLYVDKPKPCPNCQQPPCSKLRCINGYVGQRRPYVPVAFISARDGTIDHSIVQRLACDRLFALGMFTIRRPKARRESPKSPVFDATFPTPAEISSAAGSTQTSLTAAKAAVPKSKLFVLSTDRPRMELLQTLIRQYDPQRFGSILVRQAVTNPSSTQYTVQVQGPGRHACLNCIQGKVHARSTVYFIVDAAKGVCQRCNSKSDKVDTRITRKMCRHFRSAWLPFSLTTQPHIREVLFASIQVVSSLKLLIDNGNVLCMDPSNYVPDHEDDESEGDEEAAGAAGAALESAAAATQGFRIQPAFGAERSTFVQKTKSRTTMTQASNPSALIVSGASCVAVKDKGSTATASTAATALPVFLGRNSKGAGTAAAATTDGSASLSSSPSAHARDALKMSDQELGIPASWRVGGSTTTRKRNNSTSNSNGSAGPTDLTRHASTKSSLTVLMTMTNPRKKPRTKGEPSQRRAELKASLADLDRPFS